jgi:hypothetical protein
MSEEIDALKSRIEKLERRMAGEEWESARLNKDVDFLFAAYKPIYEMCKYVARFFGHSQRSIDRMFSQDRERTTEPKPIID